MAYADTAKNFAMIGGTGARPVGPIFRNFRLANGWQLSNLFLGLAYPIGANHLRDEQEGATDPSQHCMVVPKYSWNRDWAKLRP
jgi:hypothetical protein